MTFAKLAPGLFSLGYPTLPAVGKKVYEEGWQSIKLTAEKVAHWAGNGSANCNIGIRTGDDSLGVPLTLADVDIYNRDVARAVAASIVETFGQGIERRGQAPKRAFVFAQKAVFRKISSPVWVDPDGVENRVEWLGKGQQFVAFGIHPDTGKPYNWPEASLADIDPWELIEVDEADVIDWMDNVLPGLIPSTWVKNGDRKQARGAVGEDAALINYRAPLDIDFESFREAVLKLDADMGHDEWVKVMMAIHHQTSGSDEGLALAHEWSSLSDQYKNWEVDQKWRSMRDDPSRGAVVTAATVLHMVKNVDDDVRIETVQGYQADIAAADTDGKLQRLVENKIAYDKSLSTIDLAKLEGDIKRRFAELGVNLPIATVRRMLKKKGSRPLPDLSSEGSPQETEANLRTICENNSIVIRYNVIRKDDEILIPGAAWSLDNARSASITMLRSLCHKAELSTKYLKNFVTLLADCNQYNPVVEWIDSREWDGVSRLKDWYGTVVENPEECRREVKEMLMRRWAVSAVAAAYSPAGIMARGVLVFQGIQYAGKTRWVQSLVPEELDLIKTGKSLNVHDKDSVKQILSGWIAELGEIDSTFKKADISSLKAFITQNIDELRRPYAEAESRFARRTVFCGSVNDKQYLQDGTGNSRFWTIPVISVDHNHKLDMQQVWAEIKALWQAGEIHYLLPDEMKVLNEHNETFEVVNPVAELIINHLAWDDFKPDNCQWMSASDVLRWLGMNNPTKWDTIEAGRVTSKMNGHLLKRTGARRLLAVPHNKRGVTLDFSSVTEDF